MRRLFGSIPIDSVAPSLHYRSSILDLLSRKLSRVFVIALVVPLRDFPSRRAPDAVMGADVVECLFQVLDAKRHADDEGMERQAEYAPARGAVLI